MKCLLFRYEWYCTYLCLVQYRHLQYVPDTVFQRIIIGTVMHVYSTLFVNCLTINKEAVVYTDGCPLAVIIRNNEIVNF
jgi:hypothetical protein